MAGITQDSCQALVCNPLDKHLSFAINASDIYYSGMSLLGSFRGILAFIWNHYAPVTNILNSFILLMGGLFTITQISIARKSADNARLIAIYSNLMVHNNSIYDDEYKKRAVDLFRGLDSGADKVSNLEGEKLYWAARSIHLNHLNILVQVWLLLRKKRKLEPGYQNWEIFASGVFRELRGDTSKCKPLPYRKACNELWIGLTSIEAYPKGFLEWLVSTTRA